MSSSENENEKHDEAASVVSLAEALARDIEEVTLDSANIYAEIRREENNSFHDDSEDEETRFSRHLVRTRSTAANVASAVRAIERSWDRDEADAFSRVLVDTLKWIEAFPNAWNYLASTRRPRHVTSALEAIEPYCRPVGIWPDLVSKLSSGDYDRREDESIAQSAWISSRLTKSPVAFFKAAAEGIRQSWNKAARARRLLALVAIIKSIAKTAGIALITVLVTKATDRVLGAPEQQRVEVIVNQTLTAIPPSAARAIWTVHAPTVVAHEFPSAKSKKVGSLKFGMPVTPRRFNFKLGFVLVQWIDVEKGQTKTGWVHGDELTPFF